MNSADRYNSNDDVLNILNKLAFLFESIQVLNVPKTHIYKYVLCIHLEISFSLNQLEILLAIISIHHIFVWFKTIGDTFAYSRMYHVSSEKWLLSDFKHI